MKNADKPNILFILIDDMGWKDLSCYGSTYYETPNIDKLATQGMVFTDAYAACPVCSPTRASLLTGKYPATLGVTDWINWSGNLHPCKGKLVDVPYIKHLPTEEKSIAKALKDEGYTTWHVGKWHLGGKDYNPEKHGFDINIGGCHLGAPCNGYFSPYGIENLKDGPKGEYLTDRLTDEAIHLIKNNDRPFFLNFWHYAVHNPVQAKKEDIIRFKNKAKSMGLDEKDALVEGEYFPSEHKKSKRVTRRVLQSNPTYAAMIYNLDWNIGRLLDVLKETGQEDNTVIIFTSDNGGLSTSEGSPTCNLPLNEGKGWMYEGGVREPLIIKWPGVIKPKSTSSTPVTSPDFYPTLLDIANTPHNPRQHSDGISILPILKGDDKLKRDAVYWHYPHYGNQGGTPGSSIRMGDYKLIEFFEDGRLELYNLKNDLEEKKNLASSLPGITKKLHNKLKSWRDSVEAKIPQKNPDYKD